MRLMRSGTPSNSSRSASTSSLPVLIPPITTQAIVTRPPAAR